MAGRQSASQNLPKFTLKMKDERMKNIVTVFQYFILSQNFLAELCHERYQDKICEEGRGTRPLQFSEKEIQIGAMRSESDDYQIRVRG